VLAGGAVLGPEFLGIRVRSRQAVLVFVDFHPEANFGHDCRYLLFDPDSARLVEEYAASYPPFPKGWPRHYRRFDAHRPHLLGKIVLVVKRSLVRFARALWTWLGFNPPGQCSPPPPPLPGAGRRFAILFAGKPDPCHLNTMEFGYRTLRCLGFDAANIIVCCYLEKPAPSCPKWEAIGGNHLWPGDETAFQMVVNHFGTQAGFKLALNDLNQKQPGPSDLLFIFTIGHGGSTNDAGPTGCYLITPDEKYSTTDFQQDLALLQDGQPGVPRFGRLVVMMGQCCAGGFRQAVLDSGVAGSIAFASASKWDTWSYNDGQNDNEYTWSCFAKDWFAAQRGNYYDGASLDHSADTIPAGSPDSRISAKEAYDYAFAKPPGHLQDQPVECYSAVAAQALALDGS
jgi:hypothetical protein